MMKTAVSESQVLNDSQMGYVGAEPAPLTPNQS